MIVINLECNYLFAGEVSSNWMTNNTFYARKIYVKKGMVTTIQFNSLIQYMVVGDELIAESKAINEHTVLISPKLPNEETNLNVTTLEGNFVFVIKTLDYKDPIEPHLHINVGKLSGVPLISLTKKYRRRKLKLN